ncbi:MAG: DUF1361 domain-containing protein [Candidatus Falkowbacteria bacterium]
MIWQFVGQQAPGSLDQVFEYSPWLSLLMINGYPLLSLVWNLLLLLVPLWAVISLERCYKKTKCKSAKAKAEAAFWFLLWLAFIPNAAYIITDVRHLVVPGCQMSSYYRVCSQQAWAIIFFFTYACAGWVSFVFLTRRMKNLLAKIYNPKIGRYFVWLLMPLVSLGVLLGLLDRWNSWQLVSAPFMVLQSVLPYFYEWIRLKNWLIFTICLYLLYWAGDMLFVNAFYLREHGGLPTKTGTTNHDTKVNRRANGQKSNMKRGR